MVCIGSNPDAQAVVPGLCGGTGAGADLVAVVVQHIIVAHDSSGVGSRLSNGIRIGNDLVLGDRIAVAQNERGIGALLIHISCIALSIADGSVADQNVEIRCFQLGLLDGKFVLLRGDIAARAAVGSCCHSGKGVIACIYGLLAAQQHAVRIVNCGKLLCTRDIGHGNIAIALSGSCTHCHTVFLAVIYGVGGHGKGKVCGVRFRFGVRLDVICDGECTICHRAALVPCAAFGDDGIVIFTRLNRRTMDHFAAAHLIEHGDLTVVLGAVVCHSHFLGVAVIGQVSGLCHGKVCGVQCSLLNGKRVIPRGHIAARAGGSSCYSNGKGVSARLNGSTVQHLAVLLVCHGNSAVFLGGVFPNDHLHHLGVAVIGRVGGQGKGKVCGVCIRQRCHTLIGGAQVEDMGLRDVILAQVDGAVVAFSIGYRAVIGYAVHALDGRVGRDRNGVPVGVNVEGGGICVPNTLQQPVDAVDVSSIVFGVLRCDVVQGVVIRSAVQVLGILCHQCVDGGAILDDTALVINRGVLAAVNGGLVTRASRIFHRQLQGALAVFDCVAVLDYGSAGIIIAVIAAVQH